MTSDYFRSRWPTFRDGLVFGAGFGIAFIAVVFAVVIFSGNQEQRTLNEMRQLQETNVGVGRATVCVLLQPADADGRSELLANSVCLIPNGLDPGDWDQDGHIDIDGP